MSDLGTAFVRIRPNTTGFKGEAERGIRSGLGSIGKIIGGSFAAAGLAEGVKRVAEAAASQQEELAVVRQSIKSTNAAWKIHGHTVSEILREQAVKFGFTVSDLAQGFTRIQVSTKNTSKSMTLLDSAMDIARARHLGLAQAAVVVAKAQSGNVTGLQRLGIVIPKVTTTYDLLKRKYDDAVASGEKFSKQDKLTINNALDAAKARDKEATKLKVLEEIQTRFGGQSANFARTAEGSSQRFHEAVNELEVSIGKGLLPSLTQAASGATKLFKKLADGGQVQAFAAGTAKELGSAYKVVKGIASALAPPLERVAQAVGAVAHAATGGGIVAIAIGYKSLSVATTLAHTAQEKYNAVTKAGLALGEAEASAAEEESAAANSKASAIGRSTLIQAAATNAVQDESIALAKNVDALLAAEAATAKLAASQEALAAKYRISGNAVYDADGKYVTSTHKVEEFASTAARSGAKIESLGSKIRTIGKGLFSLAGGWSTVGAIALGAAAYGIYRVVTAEDAWDRANQKVAESLSELDRESQRAIEIRKQITFLTHQIPSDNLALSQAKLNEQNAIAALYASKAAKNSREFKQLQLDVAQAIQSRKDAQRQLNTDQDELTKKQREQTSNTNQHIASVKKDTDGLLGLARAAREGAKQAAKLTGLNKAIPGPPTTADKAKAEAEAAARFADAAIDRSKKAKSEIVKRNEELVAIYARQFKTIPTEKQITFILNNQNTKATLGGLLFQFDTTAAKAKVKGHRIGTSLVDGVTAGIVLNEGSIAKTLVSAVNKAQEAAKKAIGAHSPSEKTRDEIGKPIMEGIVVGIKSIDADAVLARQVSLSKTRAKIREEIKRLVPDDTHALGNVETKGGRPYLRQGSGFPNTRISPRTTAADVEPQVGRGIARAGTIEALHWLEQNRKALVEVEKLYKKDSKAAAMMRANARLVAYAFADGIRLGIADRAKMVNDALAGLLGGGVDAAKKKIGAHSPSEVARTQIGHSISDGIRLGVLDKNGDVIKSVTDQVTDAINAGTQAVRDAIVSAKQNLNSIGSSLAGDISTLLDKINKSKQSVGFKVSGPVAEALKALNVEIAKGNASPELVRKAQSLQNQLAAQSQALASKPVAKTDPDAITRKIADATDLLNKGAITLDVFNRRIHKVLKDAGATPAVAKKQLGVAFADQFSADVHGLVEQAKALLASPRLKGTGLEPQIVRPLETIRDQQKQIADAAASQRQQQLDEAKKQTAHLKKIGKAAADTAAHTKGAVTAAEIKAYVDAAKKNPSAAAKSVVGAGHKHGGG